MVIELCIDRNNELLLALSEDRHHSAPRWVYDNKFLSIVRKDLVINDIKNLERFMRCFEENGSQMIGTVSNPRGLMSAQYVIESPQHLRQCFDAIMRIATIDQHKNTISLSKDDFISIMAANKPKRVVPPPVYPATHHAYAHQNVFHRSPLTIARDLVISLDRCHLPAVTISADLSGGTLKRAILNAIQNGINHCNDPEQLYAFQEEIEHSEAWQTLQRDQGMGIRQYFFGTTSSIDAVRNMFEERARSFNERPRLN